MGKQRILVPGGAGYIGSACVQNLCDGGYAVTVIDNLRRGKRDKVDPRAGFVQLDIADRENLHDLMRDGKFDAVMHFAAHKDVGESMRDAVLYSENVRNMVNVLDGMVGAGIPKIIFSSSAAVYGEAQFLPITEDHPVAPVNYYGITKRMCEQLMEWYHRIHGLNYVSLRYFNVAGDVGLNYLDPQAGNLFFIILEVLRGNRDHLTVYGDDYPTRDGTCVRDYLHLADLARAHTLCVEKADNIALNFGTGAGTTVQEILSAFESELGHPLPVQMGERRTGDVPALAASSAQAEKLLGWQPEKTLTDMVRSTLAALEGGI